MYTTVIDDLAAKTAALYAAKTYPVDMLHKAMIAHPDKKVFTLAWMYAYTDQTVLPQFKL